MKNVLLIDDDRIFNFLSSKTLERVGGIGHIDTVLNGLQAINLLATGLIEEKRLPDVILLDLCMPIMDGFGFLEAFHQLDLPGKERIRIIVVSSSQDPADIARGRLLGVDQYLAKPLEEHSLREALELPLTSRAA